MSLCFGPLTGLHTLHTLKACLRNEHTGTTVYQKPNSVVPSAQEFFKNHFDDVGELSQRIRIILHATHSFLKLPLRTLRSSSPGIK